MRQELAAAREVAARASSTWDKFRKERDFHRMHHKRVAQEKNRLIADVKRLKVGEEQGSCRASTQLLQACKLLAPGSQVVTAALTHGPQLGQDVANPHVLHMLSLPRPGRRRKPRAGPQRSIAPACAF